MPQTRPRLEQITFKSAKTGTQNLDAYLEAAEIGDRTLASLMGDLFDANGNFAPEEILPEFRIDQTGGTTKLQYRTDATNPWEDLVGFFNDRGNFATGTAYNALDLVTVDDGTTVDLYIVKSDQSNTAFSSQSEFVNATSTQLITTNTATILQDVRDARDDVLQDAGFIAVSTDLQADPSKIQTVSDNLGTDQAVTVVADDLNLGASSKIATVNTNISNVNATGGSIANVNTVAAQLTPTGDVTVVANDLNDPSSYIEAVAGAITNVNNVGGNIPAITTVSQQIGTGLDVTVVADDLDDGVTSKIKITADNIADVNTVADNIGVGQAITTVANDLNATPSNIANFVGGLDATIDDLTIQGVAKGAVDTASTTTYDMSTANNYVFDRANGATLTLSNAHLCANMQPFTIVVKEDGSSSFTISATNGTIKYANNVAPTLDGQSGRLVVLTGFVFEPDTVTPANTTIVICHTKVYS